MLVTDENPHRKVWLSRQKSAEAVVPSVLGKGRISNGG